jgi:hypothetical protein
VHDASAPPHVVKHCNAVQPHVVKHCNAVQPPCRLYERTIRIDRPRYQSLGEGRATIARAGECSALESSAAADSTSAGERVSCADTICTRVAMRKRDMTHCMQHTT